MGSGDETTWTTAQAAAYCGVSPGRFRALASAHGLATVGEAPAAKPAEGGYGQASKLYRAQDVTDMQAKRKGQGYRSDLHEKEKG